MVIHFIIEAEFLLTKDTLIKEYEQRQKRNARIK